MPTNLRIPDESDTRAPLKSIRPQFRLLDEADARDQLENLRSECAALGQPLPAPSGDLLADLDSAEAHAVRARVAARLPHRAAAQETGRAMSQTAKCQADHAAAAKPAPAPAAAPKPPTPPAAAQVPAGAMSQTELCQAARAAARASKAPPAPTAAPLSRQAAERGLADACSDYTRRSKAEHDARQIDQIAALAAVMRAP